MYCPWLTRHSRWSTQYSAQSCSITCSVLSYEWFFILWSLGMSLQGLCGPTAENTHTWYIPNTHTCRHDDICMCVSHWKWLTYVMEDSQTHQHTTPHTTHPPYTSSTHHTSPIHILHMRTRTHTCTCTDGCYKQLKTQLFNLKQIEWEALKC